ncbi:MAG: RNA methyltransferase [bacterium]|nr:RNA methyltransferase [bacterium]
MEKITSLQNPRVKQIRRLRERKTREAEQRFLIDYERDLERALAQGFEVDYLFYCSDLDREGMLLPESLIFEVERDLMEKVSYRENPSSLVAVMKIPSPRPLSDLLSGEESLLLCLVGLEKPGNVGALLRSADAAGFSAVLLVDSPFDLYNPNLIRASTGAIFLGNVYQSTSPEALQLLKAARYQCVGAIVDGSVSLFEVDFRPHTALILGTEDIGLDERWKAACDVAARIPMQGLIADSLNVSVSGALFMYEAVRQRLKGTL